MNNEKIVLHGYIWFKLVQWFLGLWQESLGFVDLFAVGFLEMLTSIPAYILFIAYLFEIHIKYRKLCISLWLVSVGHEGLMFIESWWGINNFGVDDYWLEFLVLALLAPLYIVSFNYLFRSPYSRTEHA